MYPAQRIALNRSNTLAAPALSSSAACSTRPSRASTASLMSSLGANCSRRAKRFTEEVALSHLKQFKFGVNSAPFSRRSPDSFWLYEKSSLIMSHLHTRCIPWHKYLRSLDLFHPLESLNGNHTKHRSFYQSIRCLIHRFQRTHSIDSPCRHNFATF